MKKNFLLATFALALAFFSACDRKTDTTELTSDTNTTEDVVSSIDYDAASDLDEDVAADERGGDCPTRTFANPQGTWPNTLTIDYGDACLRPDGRTLKGKIIITQSDNSLMTAGATRTVTYGDFYVDATKVEGTKTVTNNGIGADGFYSMSKVVDKKLIFADGTSTSWAGNHTRTLIEGAETTLNPLDNIWSSTGSGSGINREGETFSCQITEPLLKKTFCRWISKGVVTWTKDTKTRSLNFGDGTCDKFGDLTRANGEVVTITLRR